MMKLPYYIGVLFLTIPFTIFAQAPAGTDHSQVSMRIDTSQIELPIYINYDNNTVTPEMEVTVNYHPIKVVFDSGSYGLRILSGAIPGALIDSTSGRINYAYGDGKKVLALRGNVALVDLSFGKISITQPVKIMLIDSARYGPVGNNWTSTIDSATIDSKHFRKIGAIMGVGLRYRSNGKGITSPLGQINGSGRYIVEFPDFGGRKGRLILNPSPVEMAGFTFFHLKQGKTTQFGLYPSWLDNELYGCIRVNSTADVCLPAMLDSGNPVIQVLSNQFAGSKALPSRSFVSLKITDTSNTNTSVTMNFRIAENREQGKDYVLLSEAKTEGKLILGIRTFFEFDILYDQKNGIIGLRRKQ